MKNAIIRTAGCAANADIKEEETAKRLCLEAPGIIFGDTSNIRIAPNAVEAYHDMKDVSEEFSPSWPLSKYMVLVAVAMGIRNLKNIYFSWTKS